MNINQVQPHHAVQIAKIYNHYIKNTVITFEEQPVNAQEILQRIEEIHTKDLPYLVAETPDQTILGYAYADKWKGRCAYKFSIETSIYMNPMHLRQGVGKTLYAALIEILKAENYNTIIGSIALPNKASIRLHESLGFKKAAHFQEVGYKFEQWVDVGYWQLLL